MRARWDARNRRWEASRGSGRSRKWFRSKIEGEEGRLIVEAKARAFEQGPAPLPPGSLAEFIENVWWPVTKARTVYNTRLRYKSVVDNDLAPLQPLQLADLRLPVLQAWVSELEKKDSPKTVRLKWGVLKGILTMARQTGRTAHDDHLLVRPPRVPPSRRTALDPAQVAALVAACDDPALQGMVWAASHMGLRLSELLGLTPASVRLEDDCAVVTVSQGRHAWGVQDRLKSKAQGEGRTLHVPREWGERLLGCWRPGTVFLFTSEDGRPIPTARPAKAMPRLCERARVPRVTFHDLRHACASNLRAAGVPETTVQEVLGHGAIVQTRGYMTARRQEVVGMFARLESKG